MKKSIKKSIVAIAAIATISTMSAVTCFAANWGDLATVTISDDNWHNQFDGPYDTKESDSEKWAVYSTAMTMYSNPQVKLINSNGEARSNAITVAHTYRQYTGDNNTGTNGYVYYTKTKGAWNQIGTDTMKYQINADQP